MKRTVILLWKGYSWRFHEVEAPTGLAADLPRWIEAMEDGTGRQFQFAIAGDCAGTPIYKQPG